MPIYILYSYDNKNFLHIFSVSKKENKNKVKDFTDSIIFKYSTDLKKNIIIWLR